MRADCAELSMALADAERSKAMHVIAKLERYARADVGCSRSEPCLSFPAAPGTVPGGGVE
jgi:hypothetical protein